MKNSIKISFLLLFWSLSLQVTGQELPHLNSYIFNQFIYNPASGGMYESDFNFNSSGRFQWSGITGAPLTNYSWADFRFSKNSMSAGLVFTYDQSGARRFSDVAANYTYIIRLSNKLKFSVGLRVGVTSSQFNSDYLGPRWDSGDPLLETSSYTYPKFGTGAQLYTRKFYIGIGLPDLVAVNNNAASNDYGKNFFQKNRNYTLMAGYRIKLSDGFSLYPNSKVYYFPKPINPFRADVSLLGEVTDYFWAGASYATSGNASFMVGTYLSSSMRFMYAYEFILNSSITSQTNLTTHEINLMIQLDNLFSKKNRTK
ncbi:MAG: PorP/SprF family type IX secretion system membrane protein [Cytophagales bacterium]|nr:PorP/SprF family type IX secretion system membrane protein [Cytophagales bacterium]